MLGDAAGPLTPRKRGWITLDLKRVLMELGNRLVTECHYTPGHQPLQSQVRQYFPDERRTAIIILFTEFMNAHPNAREILRELGLAWSI